MAEEQREGLEASLDALEQRMHGPFKPIRHTREWRAAETFVAEAPARVSEVAGLPLEQQEAQWEELLRHVTAHNDALEVVLETHQRQVAQDKRAREQRWATEKGRLEEVKGQFLVLKILMILAWTCALGLGLSFRTLGILAVAPAGLGCLEVVKLRRKTEVIDYVVEREEAQKIHDDLRIWLGGYVAAVVIAGMLVLIKSTVLG